MNIKINKKYKPIKSTVTTTENNLRKEKGKF